MKFDLDTYSGQAEQFVSELDREYHLHFSGQQSTYEVQEIYERHRDLFGKQAIEALRTAARADEGERGRRASLLLELAVGGFLGLACAAEEEEIARREAELELRLDGDAIPYRRVASEQANEPDAARRAALQQARLELLVEHINPLHLETLERTHSLIGELGWESYARACAELREVDLEGLAWQARRFLEATESVYEAIMDPELERVLDMPLIAVQRSDLGRFFRAPDLDSSFPAERLVESFARTMAGIGLDLAAQPNVLLDTEERPSKTPRAYCAPVRVPGEVYLVVPRIGGREDYAALFHEGGHAEHYANVDPVLPAEFRYLGDNSVTESYAFLIEHLIEQPPWLGTVLGSADGERVAAHVRAVKLFFLRRYAAKIAYELELHGAGADLGSMAGRYAELLGGATGVEWTPSTWLEDVDSGFYVACYLRAWALEAKWRAALQERFGESWFAEPAAGQWLIGLWRKGQRHRADELAAETLGERLDLADLAQEFV
ncbi:MAG: hypothetical protein ACRDKV_05920 [Solirubrobacterales bacterium]